MKIKCFRSFRDAANLAKQNEISGAISQKNEPLIEINGSFFLFFKLNLVTGFSADNQNFKNVC